MSKGRSWVFLLAVLVYTGGYAEGIDINAERAHYNYMMFCQGCHLPEGRGSEGRVPRLKDYVGHFLKVEGGREFLVRVPGSANAAIDDHQLAELLNWIVKEFAGESFPDDFDHFSGEEIAGLRKEPLNEVIDHRARLVKRIALLDDIDGRINVKKK